MGRPDSWIAASLRASFDALRLLAMTTPSKRAVPLVEAFHMD
jgi:hypothetical protein